MTISFLAAMSSIKKFLFDTSFDAGRRPEPEPEPETPPEPPPPTFSEAELAAARNEAFAQGKQEGLAEAAAGLEQAIADGVAALATQVDSLIGAQTEHEARQQSQAIETAVQVVRKLFPRIAEARALPEIEAVIAECLGHLSDEPRVVVRIADPLIDPLRERLSSLAARSGFEGKVVLISDDTLEASSVRVEWAAGGAERDTAQIWQEIEEVIARRLGGDRRADETPENHTDAAAATDRRPPVSTARHDQREPALAAQTA